MADYILNMGGNDGDQDISAVDVFQVTANGVEHKTDHGLSLSAARARIATASCGNYILAMGGDSGGSSGTIYDTVDVFKATENGIEHKTDHSLSLSAARSILAAASCGNYILAMGGDNGGTTYNTVDVFKVTDNGIEHILDHGLTLSVPRSYLAAASCGNYILAMGGVRDSVGSAAVDVFKITANGVEHTHDYGLPLSVPRSHLVAAACGNYILAMGGDNGGTTYNTVDVFKVTDNGIEHILDHSLTLSVPRSHLAAASCGNYILAMGGRSETGYSAVVDVFQITSSGVEHIPDYGLTLSEPRPFLAAASCGNYILAMGGATTGSVGSHRSDAVDVFQVL